jgi:hypothetical protein
MGGEARGMVLSDEGKWRWPEACLIQLLTHGGERKSTAPAGAVEAQVLPEEGDDPGWAGWAEMGCELGQLQVGMK